MTGLTNEPRALVLGLGDSGLAMARFLCSRGHSVRVADTRLDPPRLADLRAELRQAEFVGGEFSSTLLDDVQLLALSPGLSPTLSAAAPLIRAAHKRKIEVLGESITARKMTYALGTAYIPNTTSISTQVNMNLSPRTAA